ncbi:ABC transporter substrate-binding protein [Reinekea marinisedimentorum]|uniref:ABC-type uncharacterized transport system substrate-binding protein n=1 Tax=Reinekea marinisedimentorum TaxID=230495 RepID=A0A4R3I8S2_9GAMM|nr:ABC transporter substrate binding protein [Reinekea marinisedimentorum]TCS41406.1 ABC-type uncharacterized transport system substrate-binding protein [Reinekea marinisedimentorum]
MINKWIASLALMLLCLSAQATTIFIVSSYHPEYQWDADYVRAIKENSSSGYEFIQRSLDSKNLPPEQWQQKAAEIVAEIRKTKPDVVVIGDDNALTTVGMEIKTSGIPIVFLGINGSARQYGLGGGSPMTGIYERPFIEASIRHVSKVTKGNLPILVLMDNSTTMQNTVSEKFADQRSVEVQGTQVDILLTNSAREWKTAIAGAHERYRAVIVGTYHTLRHDDGAAFSDESAMLYAQTALKVPLFALWDFSVAPDKAAGGYVISAYEEGKSASRIIRLVLSGVPVSSIASSNSQTGHYIYSKKAMEKWGIQLSPLVASQSTFLK